MRASNYRKSSPLIPARGNANRHCDVETCQQVVFEGLEPRLLLTTVPMSWIVPIGDGSAGQVTYQEADQTQVTVMLRNGTGTLRFEGDIDATVADRRGVTVTGDNIALSGIALDVTSDRSLLQIRTGREGDGLAEVGEITGTMPLGRLIAKTTDLTGDGILITGDGYIGMSLLHNLKNGADIVMEGTDAPRGITIMAGQLLSGSDISLGSYLKALTLVEWDGSSLSAPYASKILIRGDRRNDVAGNFGADITLTGADSKGVALNKLQVTGTITDSVISAMFGSVGTIMAAQWDSGAIETTWLKSIMTKGNRRDASISGNIGADMSLDGTGATKTTLGRARIAGDLDGGTWSITGNAGVVMMAGLRGELLITGNAARVTLSDPLAVCPPLSGSTGKLQVGGLANVRSSQESFRFTNAELFASTPDMYRMEDLRRYDVPGAWWTYDASYSGSLGSGTGTGTVSVDDQTVMIDGHECTVVGSETMGTEMSIAWYTDGTGTHATAWGFDSDFGDMEFYLDSPMVAPEYLRMGQQYTDSAPFAGDWILEYYGDSIIGNVSGTADVSSKLVGHEQITVPTGTYLAVEVQLSIALQGTIEMSLWGQTYTGTFTATQQQTWWGVPEIGAVRADTSMTVSVSVAGAGRESVKLTTSQELIDYGMVKPAQKL